MSLAVRAKKAFTFKMPTNKCNIFIISQLLSFLEMGLYGLSIMLVISEVDTVYVRIPYSLTFSTTITILATFLEFIGIVIKSKSLLIFGIIWRIIFLCAYIIAFLLLFDGYQITGRLFGNR